jgi:hypothetical protein
VSFPGAGPFKGPLLVKPSGTPSRRSYRLKWDEASAGEKKDGIIVRRCHGSTRTASACCVNGSANGSEHTRFGSRDLQRVKNQVKPHCSVKNLKPKPKLLLPRRASVQISSGERGCILHCSDCNYYTCRINRPCNMAPRTAHKARGGTGMEFYASLRLAGPVRKSHLARSLAHS